MLPRGRQRPHLGISQPKQEGGWFRFNFQWFNIDVSVFNTLLLTLRWVNYICKYHLDLDHHDKEPIYHHYWHSGISRRAEWTSPGARTITEEASGQKRPIRGWRLPITRLPGIAWSHCAWIFLGIMDGSWLESNFWEQPIPRLVF